MQITKNSSKTQSLTATDFVAALGYQPDSQIRLRAFKARNDPNQVLPRTWAPTLSAFEHDQKLRAELEKANELRGIYVVINFGGDTNDEITEFNSFFVENDNLSLSEQHQRLDASPLATSARLETKKSVHAYFFLKEPLRRQLPELQKEKRAALDAERLKEKDWLLTDVGKDWSKRWAVWLKTVDGQKWQSIGRVWRDLETRIIAFFDADKSIKNEARLMRLPFFNHVAFDDANLKYNFKTIEIVQLDKECRYSVEDLETAFPPVADEKQNKSANKKSNVDEIKTNRNTTLISLVGQWRAAGMSENAILAAALAENTAKCKPPLDESEVKDIVSRYAHQAAEPNEIEWLENPKPLDLTLKPVEPLDADCLPEILVNWLRPAAKVIGCPFDFLVLSAIVRAGSLIGSRLRIMPQVHSDWAVVPNLYAGIVGLPSTKKTPALDETRKPILELQCAAREAFEKEKTDYEIEAQWYEKERAKILKESKTKSDFRNRLDDLKKPFEPIQKRFEVGDITTPKLVQFLSQNRNGLELERDELTAWLKSLEADYDKSARAFYLELSKGAVTTSLDRADGREISLPSATLSIIGGVQPSKLQRFVTEAYSFDNSDGFLQRFVFAYPDTNKKTKPPTDDDYRAQKAGFKEANKFFKQLAIHDFGGKVLGANGDIFRVVKFSVEAQKEVDNWKDEIETEAESLQIEDEAFSAFLYKLPKTCFAIALIFHCLESDQLDNLPDEISPATTIKAFAYTEVLISHARRVFALGENQIFALAQTLLGKIKRGDLLQGFKARDVARKQWSGLKTPDTVKDVLGLLVDYGYLKALEVNNGKPTVNYFYHPSLESEAKDENELEN